MCLSKFVFYACVLHVCDSCAWRNYAIVHFTIVCACIVKMPQKLCISVVCMYVWFLCCLTTHARILYYPIIAPLSPRFALLLQFIFLTHKLTHTHTQTQFDGNGGTYINYAKSTNNLSLNRIKKWILPLPPQNSITILKIIFHHCWGLAAQRRPRPGHRRQNVPRPELGAYFWISEKRSRTILNSSIAYLFDFGILWIQNFGKRKFLLKTSEIENSKNENFEHFFK